MLLEDIEVVTEVTKSAVHAKTIQILYNQTKKRLAVTLAQDLATGTY